MNIKITGEQLTQLKKSYEANKVDLADVEREIEENGITNDGVTDVSESFEQGFNNALEMVFTTLGINL